MSVIPDRVNQEDLFALLVLKSHQLTAKEKQMMLSDLSIVKARRLYEEQGQAEQGAEKEN